MKDFKKILNEIKMSKITVDPDSDSVAGIEHRRGMEINSSDIERKPRTLVAKYSLTPEIIQHMRNWVSDCSWKDLGGEELNELSDEIIARGVERHYEGGIKEFLKSLFQILIIFSVCFLFSNLPIKRKLTASTLGTLESSFT